MKLTLLLSLVLAGVGTANAQTRVLVGPSGSDAFSNESFGIAAAVEVPFAKQYEFDWRDNFSPIQSHSGLGRGRANVLRVGGVGWTSDMVGITASFQQSRYSSPAVSKTGYDIFLGPIFRFTGWGSPIRIEIDYVREVLNRMAGGIEPSRLQGANVEMTVRLGCAGPFCYRMRESISGGRVLTQGNPACDGEGIRNPALLPCPRKSASGGGFAASFMIEWPRPKNNEMDKF